jgi:hypothetical protein
MSDQRDLQRLLEAEISPGNPSFIIYHQQPSARLEYVCRFIFNRHFKSGFSIVNNAGEFNGPGHIKINYSAIPIPGSLRVIPSGLLSQKGVPGDKPLPFYKNDRLYFYPSVTNDQATLQFDIFSAVFYFISRAEEWQPFVKDLHARFEADRSILYDLKYHLKPVVDIWINEFIALVGTFGAVTLEKPRFTVMSTIDVDNLFAFKAKGLLRTTGAMVKDLLKADARSFITRLKVIAGKIPDPFDVYADVSAFCRSNKIPLVYFFLFRNGGRYDRTVNPGSGAFLKVFEKIRAYGASIGLHPSYNTSADKRLFCEELKHLSSRLMAPVIFSRQHYLRFDIRSTPKLLMECGIIADFTMGYASKPGFRAGTSFPFHYYDFEKEEETKLLFVPFCAMDGAYVVYEKYTPESALLSMMTLAREIKRTNGFFITVFHERTFYDHLYKGFGTLYKKLYEQVKQLQEREN